MKPKRIVLALGGNALGENLPEQMKAGKRTVKTIADLLEEGHQMVITHGNGPQVGMINMAMTTLSREDPSHPMAFAAAWRRCSPRWRWTPQTRLSSIPPSPSEPL